MSSKGFARYLHYLADRDWDKHGDGNTDSGAPTLRCDGIYEAKWDEKISRYIVFVPNGEVRSVSSPAAQSDVVFKWLPKQIGFGGKYKIHENAISILLYDGNEYLGEVKHESIELYFGLGEDPLFYGVFQFVKVSELP